MPLQGKLGFDTKLSFGVGQAAEGLFGAAYGTFLIFYYNQVLGMSGSLAGAAVGIALVVDAFTDPLAGSLSDHWKSRYGRRHPFMYASIVPLAVSFYFLFNPLVTSEFGLFIWLVVFSNATRTAMSLYHVPHIALGAEMSEDYDERSKLVATGCSSPTSAYCSRSPSGSSTSSRRQRSSRTANSTRVPTRTSPCCWRF